MSRITEAGTDSCEDGSKGTCSCLDTKGSFCFSRRARRSSMEGIETSYCWVPRGRIFRPAPGPPLPTLFTKLFPRVLGMALPASNFSTACGLPRWLPSWLAAQGDIARFWPPVRRGTSLRCFEKTPPPALWLAGRFIVGFFIVVLLQG